MAENHRGSPNIPPREICMPLEAYAVTTSQHSSAVKLVQRENELVLEHSHEYYELVAVLRGDGEHVVDGVAVPLFAREVFLIPPGTRHYFRDFTRIVLLEFFSCRNFSRRISRH